MEPENSDKEQKDSTFPQSSTKPVQDSSPFTFLQGSCVFHTKRLQESSGESKPQNHRISNFSYILTQQLDKT